MGVEVDFLLVRSQAVCPLCRGAKELGGLVCWPCYGAWQLRYGNAEADKLIVAFAEKLLAQELQQARRAIERNRMLTRARKANQR